MIISKTCKACGRLALIHVPRGGYTMWARGLKNIQKAMPDLSDDERELLISGICGACFDKLTSMED